MGTNYSPKIVTDGLIFYPDAANPKSYPGSGSVWYDMSGNGYSGTISGATLDGNSFSFDGINNYIKISDNISSGLTEITVSVCMQPVSGGSNYRCAIHKGSDSSVGNSEYWIGVSGGSNITATIGARNGVGWAAGETTETVSYGNWYVMTATYDGTTVRVYINGEEKKSYALTGYVPIAFPTRFGASTDGTAYQYAGLVESGIIYDRALTSDEVKQNFNALRSRFNI